MSFDLFGNRHGLLGMLRKRLQFLQRVVLQAYRPALEEGADERASISDLRLFHVKRTASKNSVAERGLLSLGSG